MLIRHALAATYPFGCRSLSSAFHRNFRSNRRRHRGGFVDMSSSGCRWIPSRDPARSLAPRQWLSSLVPLGDWKTPPDEFLPLLLMRKPADGKSRKTYLSTMQYRIPATTSGIWLIKPLYRAGLSQSAALFQIVSLPLLSLPSSSLSPPRHEAAPLKTVRGVGDCPQSHFFCIVCSQNARMWLQH